MQRNEPIPDELIDNAPCLDVLLIKMDYDELKRIFLQTGHAEESNGEQERSPRGRQEQPEARQLPARNQPKEKTADELGITKGTMIYDQEFGECEVIKISRDGGSLTVVDSKDREHMGINPNDVEVIPEDDQPPTSRGSRRSEEPPEEDAPPARSGRRREPEPEEPEESDEPEDQPTPRRSGRRPEPEPEPEEVPAPRSRRGREEPPEEAPAPRRSRREEPPEDEPEDEPAPRRRRR